MNNIENYNDLVRERARLEAALIVQRGIIKNDIIELREEYEPVYKAVVFVKRLISSDLRNPLVNVGIKVASDVILKRFILARSGWLSRLVIPAVIKNYSANFVNKITDKNNGHSLPSRIGNENYNFLQRLGQKLKK